ncbi:MAG: asparagine synthase (glutamine-hydrolyzing), partial [Flavobacteriales bacterium]|nr:asparagine synthase (glutamine-hydrolyzing) [Flavobacteriales bacterium]
CFAFAFFDHQEKRLVLARDRFGIKPLYFSNSQSQICFSSEFRSLLQLIDTPVHSSLALSALIQYSFVPGPMSYAQGVQKLLPGHVAVVEGNRFSIRRWYKPSDTTKTQGKSLLDLLSDSVQKRLVSDVPVATFLSGGVDSSAITALAHNHDQNIKAYSVGFEQGYLDESKWARMAAKHIGCELELITFAEDDVLERFPRFIQSLDEPFGDSSALAMFLLAEHASQDVKVCLSGDGADELFGGYRRHRAFWKAKNQEWQVSAARVLAPFSSRVKGGRERKVADIGRKLSKLGSLHGLSNQQIYVRLTEFTSSQHLEQIGLIPFDIPEYTWQENDLVNEYLLQDQQFILPNDMLAKVDTMSMAHGLEVRVPFLDHRLVEWANSQESKQKVNRRGGKLILKQALSELLPQEILNRPKRGFEIPVESWLKGPLRSNVLEAISKEHATNIGAEKAALVTKWKEFEAGNGNLASMFWTLLMLHEWKKVNPLCVHPIP